MLSEGQQIISKVSIFQTKKFTGNTTSEITVTWFCLRGPLYLEVTHYIEITKMSVHDYIPIF